MLGASAASASGPPSLSNTPYPDMRHATRRLAGLGLATVLFLAVSAAPAEASHFRFGKIECEPTGNTGEVECTITQAWRTTFYRSSPSNIAVGDVIRTSTMQWGDGSLDPIDLVVQSFSVAQDLFIGTLTLRHTYAASGPYEMGWRDCCRIGALRNGANQFYRVFGRIDVDVSAANAIDPTPVTSVAPVTGFPQSSTAGTPAVRQIPVADPNGESLTCSLATPLQSSANSPPGLTVTPGCEIEWDNATLAQGLYTLQVRIEEADGQITPVDFILDLGAETGTAPTCTISAASPLAVNTGDPVSFTVTAQDADDGDTVELSAVNVPAFGAMSPSLPVSGSSPQSSTFSGTAPDAEGTFFATYTATDGDGNVGQCDLTINVSEDDEPEDTEAPVCGPITVDRSGPGRVLSSATDNVGIVRATFTRLRNLDGFIDAAGPFSQGDVYDLPAPATSIAIEGVRVDVTNNRAALLVRVEDAAGNAADCDPVIDQLSSTSDVTSLGQSAPNPATGPMSIPFSLAEPGPVRLAVYDMLGREVSVLIDGDLGPGTYEVTWDGADEVGRSMAAGTYVYRLEAGPFSASRRLTIVR